jgi:hypothetical protein
MPASSFTTEVSYPAAVYIEIGALGRDPTNAARSERKIEHDGVAGHPGDRGMQAIADTLLAAVQRKAEE